MFRNPLVNVDGSTGSRAALSQAIEIARASHGRIGLLAALPRLSAWISCPPFAPAISRRQMEKDLEEAARRSIDEAERAVPADIPVTKLVMRAKPADALLTQVRTGPWDVVIVGDRLEGCPFPVPYGITRLLRGSPVPVLVVSEGSDPAPVADVEEGSERRALRTLTVTSE